MTHETERLARVLREAVQSYTCHAMHPQYLEHLTRKLTEAGVTLPPTPAPVSPLAAAAEEYSPTLERDLASALNRHSQENGSSTPDFILAQYLLGCLAAWNTGVQQRETWYGRDGRPPRPDGGPVSDEQRCACGHGKRTHGAHACWYEQRPNEYCDCEAFRPESPAPAAQRETAGEADALMHLIEQFGRWSVDVAATKELAPDTKLVAAMKNAECEFDALRAEVARLKEALGQPVPLSEWEKLEAEVAALRAERERAEETAHGRGKRLRYIAFVLSGDENADPQLWADRAKAEIERLLAAESERARLAGALNASEDEHAELAAALGWLSKRFGNVCLESDGDESLAMALVKYVAGCHEAAEQRAERLAGAVEAMREALIRVIAHTGLPPRPSHELLTGLLASVARIAKGALPASPAQAEGEVGT